MSGIKFPSAVSSCTDCAFLFVQKLKTLKADENDMKNKDNYQLPLAVCLLFSPQLLLLYIGTDWQTKAIFLICSLTICILFFQDRIKALKIDKTGLLFEFKDMISNVNATLDDLRETIQPILVITLHAITASTQGFSGINHKSAMLFFRKVLKLKKRLNLDSDDLKRAIYEARKAVITLALYDIRNSLSTTEECIMMVESIKVDNNTSEDDLRVLKKYICSADNSHVATMIYADLIDFIRETSDIDESYCKDVDRNC